LSDPIAHGASRTTRRIPPAWVLPLALGIVVALLPWMSVNDAWLSEIALTMMAALVVSGLNLSFGYAGELSLGQAAIYALGAYLAGYIGVHWSADLLLALVSSAAIAAVAGLIVGAPGLRLSAWSLAMVSFFLVLLVPDITTILQSQTGGFAGLAGIPSAELFGTTLTFNSFYVACVAVTGLWILFFRNLVLSRHGVALRVLRESPVLARSLGINVYRLKLLTYVLGSIPAGLAGALYAHFEGYISPTSFTFTATIGFLAACVLGGPRSIYGPIIGAGLLTIGPYEFTGFSTYSLVAYGLFLLLGGIALRTGITGVVTSGYARVRRLLREPGRSGPAVASATAGARDPAGANAHDAAGTLGSRSPATLAITDVSKSFGAVRALDGVSWTASGGEVCAVIGANGSGKTTLLNIVSGFYAPDGGSVRLDGDEIAGAAADRVARAGVSRTFQTPSIPEGLTVLEVVASARYRRSVVGIPAAVLRLPRFRRIRAEDRLLARQALAFVAMADAADTEAAALPLGSRRLVEVARAIAADPKVVLLDEPASGLSSGETARLGQALRGMASAGIAVILVEHNFGFVLKVADRIHVLELGSVLASGRPEEIRVNQRVIESYLGRAEPNGDLDPMASAT
jgi:branched-chain amino acid transport system permease protein